MDSRKFTEASKRRLSELLDAKSEQGNTMRCDEVQGFMTALLSGPDKLTPLDWLPEVLGDESQFTAAERSEIERLVLAMAMETTAAMSDKKLPICGCMKTKTAAAIFTHGAMLIFTVWILCRPIGLKPSMMKRLKSCFIPSWHWAVFTTKRTTALSVCNSQKASWRNWNPSCLMHWRISTATGRRSSTSRKPSAGKAKKQAGTIPVRAAAAENTRRVAVRIEAFVSMNQT